MAYAIMRMEKLKSRVSLLGALRHNSREVVPQNADPSLADSNHISHSAQKSLELYTQKLPKKVRKDAVHAVEIVLTASSEFFDSATPEQIQSFSNRSKSWLKKTFGADNLLSYTIHNDEKTPHIHAIYMPLVDGKLNAKALIGGSRNRMRDLQDDYFESVCKDLPLERGIARGARHLQPKEFARVMAEKTAELEKREQVVETKDELIHLRLKTADRQYLVNVLAEGISLLNQKNRTIALSNFKKDIENLHIQQKKALKPDAGFEL